MGVSYPIQDGNILHKARYMDSRIMIPIHDLQLESGEITSVYTSDVDPAFDDGL